MRTSTFEYAGALITTYRMTNRKREEIRQLTGKLTDSGQSYATLSEFATVVVLTASGDEGIWNRPLSTAPKSALLTALDQWLDDVDASYTDQFFLGISSLNSNGAKAIITSTEDADADPNLPSNEPSTKSKS
jgi:hypothetical protein